MFQKLRKAVLAGFLISAIPITSVSANPVGVGEHVTYNADTIQGSTSGNSSSDTDNSQDASIQANNSSVFNSMSKTYEDITGIDHTSVIDNNSQVITYKEIPVSTADIQSFIDQMNGLKGNQLNTNYKDHSAKPIKPNDNVFNVMKDLKKQYQIKPGSKKGKTYPKGSVGQNQNVKPAGLPMDAGFGTHPGNQLFKNPSPKLPEGYYNWPADRKKWTDEMNQWLTDWRNQFDKYREDLIGSGAVDQDTLPERQTIVKKYITQQINMGNDTVDTAVIKEFKVTNEKKQAVKSKIGTRRWNWMIYSDKARSKCIYSTTTTVPYISLAYDTVGTYYIDVYQDIAYTYSDLLTYDMNEYWLLQDTQQILWQKHTRKEKYLNDQAPKKKTEKVNTFTQKVTEDMVNHWIAGRGGATQKFDTERVK